MFYPFLLVINHQRQSGDRRDDVGDFALCVEHDPSWPVFCDDRDRLRAYIEAQGAGALTLAALDNAFDEYLKKVGHRLGDAKG